MSVMKPEEGDFTSRRRRGAGVEGKGRQLRGIAALEANAVAEFFEGFPGSSDHFVCEGAAFVESFRALAEKKTSRRKVPGSGRGGRWRRGPLRISMDSMTSLEWPAKRPRGWPMSVMSATHFLPMRLAVSTITSARATESSSLRMKAPEPVFTSRTSASIPSASFLLMMDAQIQADVFDRGGGVAKEERRFFCRPERFRRSADQGHAAFAEDALEIGKGKRGVEAGDGFEFVQRAAGCGRGRGR